MKAKLLFYRLYYLQFIEIRLSRQPPPPPKKDEMVITFYIQAHPQRAPHGTKNRSEQLAVLGLCKQNSREF